MREIKARVWDKQEKKMIYDAERTYDGYPVDGVYCFGELIYFPDIYDVMLYTGLKDINNKKIYKKDILQFSNGNLGEVIWSHLRAGFDVAFANAMPEGLDSILASKCEIVGNIYENKELLE